MPKFYRNGYSLSKRPSMPRPRPKKPYIPDPRTAVGMARLAYRGVKYLKSIVNVERQKLDTNVTAIGVTNTTPLVYPLNGLPVGDSEGSRTGNSILMKYVYSKTVVSIHPSATFSRVRFVIVQDTQQIGDTQPALTDVYESVSTISLLNKATVGRFKILYDKLYDLDQNNPQIIVDKYVPLNLHARYNGTASTDIQKNGLYLMLVSNEPTNTPFNHFKSSYGLHR